MKVCRAESRPGDGLLLKWWWSQPGPQATGSSCQSARLQSPESLSAFNRAGKNMQSAKCMSKLTNQDNTNRRESLGRKDNSQQASSSLHLVTRQGTRSYGWRATDSSPKPELVCTGCQGGGAQSQPTSALQSVYFTTNFPSCFLI